MIYKTVKDVVMTFDKITTVVTKSLVTFDENGNQHLKCYTSVRKVENIGENLLLKDTREVA